MDVNYKYLESKRIYLREFSKSDENDLIDLDSDPDVMKYLTNGEPSSRKSIQKMMKTVATNLKNSQGRYGVWAAIEKETAAFIGWFHLFPSGDEPNNLEKLFIGYRLKKQFWGKGYATEVCKALIEKAFENYGATEICAQSMKANQKSQNVMKKVGLTFSYEYKEKSFPEGLQDSVLFSLKRNY